MYDRQMDLEFWIDRLSKTDEKMKVFRLKLAQDRPAPLTFEEQCEFYSIMMDTSVDIELLREVIYNREPEPVPSKKRKFFRRK